MQQAWFGKGKCLVILLVGLSTAWGCSNNKSKNSRNAPAGSNADLQVGVQEVAVLVEQNLDLYVNGVGGDFGLTKWDRDSNTIVLTERESGEGQRGMILEADKAAEGPGNIIISSERGRLNLTPMQAGYLVFDIKATKLAGTGVRVRMDSGWPAASDVTLRIPESPLWQTVAVPLSDFAVAENSAQPGSRVNLASVLNPFVLEPVGEAPWHLQLDNIRIAKDPSDVLVDGKKQTVVNLAKVSSPNKWDNGTGAITATLLPGADAGRDIIEFRKTAAGPGNASLLFAGPVNLESYATGYLQFDIKVLSMDPTGVRYKIDSGWPAASDMLVERPALGEWKTVRLLLSELAAKENSLVPGNRVDLRQVQLPLVIEPDNTAPWHFQLRNTFLVSAQDHNAGGGKNVPVVIGPDENTPGGSETPTGRAVEIVNGKLFVKGKPFNIKGVCYNPVLKGLTHPFGLAYHNPKDLGATLASNLALVAKDIAMMKEAGINTVRLYDFFNMDDPDSEKFIKLFRDAEIYLIMPALNYHAQNEKDAKWRVEKLMNEPALLMWDVGNEWNYNGLYDHAIEDIKNPDLKKDAIAERVLPRIVKIVDLVKETDVNKHPVTTVYGGLPDAKTFAALSNVDVWGFNVYSWDTFGSHFADWKNLSGGKPYYMSEFGADAVNFPTPSDFSNKKVDVESQGIATEKLTKELTAHLATVTPGEQGLGGTIFEWSDEWWKVSLPSPVEPHPSPSTQEWGGIAPGDGPFPDRSFNEEWWGLVDIDRNPRPAYEALKRVYKTIP